MPTITITGDTTQEALEKVLLQGIGKYGREFNVIISPNLRFENQNEEKTELRKRNPYPEDIFVETPQMDKQKINKFCRDNGISIDGYNGSWGRKVWNYCIDELEKIQKG